jgi:hypothetical protein
MYNLLKKKNRSPEVTRERVVEMYRTLLGREPENERAITKHLSASSFYELFCSFSKSSEFTERYTKSPFFHYNSPLDCIDIMQRHARPGLRPTAGYLTNFLGVLIKPEFLPDILNNRAGEVEGIPIPANWHADIAEWAGALRAVDLAKETFCVAELGCGWGCWMNNAGVAARNVGLKTKVIGVEGDEGHVKFAREACETNGFTQDHYTVWRGIAAASDGVALFPKQALAGQQYGLKPMFNATQAQREAAIKSGGFDELEMISLERVIGKESRLDLLHIDIQGGEADLIQSSMSTLTRSVAYILVGTHSREIEGRIFADLLANGWRLEIERPAILALNPDGPSTLVDGVQAWRNMNLLPN